MMMKTAKTILSAIFLVGLGACATSDNPVSINLLDASPDSESGAIQDSSDQPVQDGEVKDTAVKSDAKKPDGAGPTCNSGCITNQNCAEACPTTTQGIYCCDFPTGVCYVEGGSACPSPDGGTDPVQPY